MSKSTAKPAAAPSAKTTPARPRRMTSPWAKLGRSGIHGRGMYASKTIPAETRVIEYIGERITKAESNRRDDARRERRKKGDDACVYIFELNKRYDLDGDLPWNTARLINHSCEPNCEPRNIRGRIWIVARREIAPGEELLFDYGFDYSNWEEHPCLCGSPKCFGYIVSKGQRWRVRRIWKKRKAAAREAAKKAKTAKVAKKVKETRGGAEGKRTRTSRRTRGVG